MQLGGSQELKRTDAGFASLFEVNALTIPLRRRVLTAYKASQAPRTAAETREAVFEQIMLAFEPNIATRLIETSRDTGVEDPVAQSIIDQLVKLGQQLRQSATPEQASRSPAEIEAILREELRAAVDNGKIYNPLLDMEG